jgi:hypothetical protein
MGLALKVDKVTGKSLISDTEITRLATLNNYTHPANHPPSIITQDASNRFTTDAEKATWNAKQNALGYTPENAANKNVANGYAGLGGDGKIISSQLPDITISDTFITASQAAMLALVAQTGDVAVRTDLNKTFILRVNNPTVLGSWQELLTPTSAVTSVNGRVGAVTAQTGDYTAAMVGAPNLTGAGASGNWGISISGNAFTANTLTTARTINGVSFNGSANITVADATKLPLTGGTLTGALNGTSINSTGASNFATTSGNVGIGTTTPAQKLTIGDGTGTGNQYTRIFSSASDLYLGQSVGSFFGLPGNGASYIVCENTTNPLGIGTLLNAPIIFGTNGVERFRIANTTGAATFSSSVTASGFFQSSDKNLKDIIKRDGDVAYFTWKDGRDSKTHIGYIAQEVEVTNPDQIQKDNEGILSVNYVEILVEKIRMLEKRLEILEGGKNGI